MNSARSQRSLTPDKRKLRNDSPSAFKRRPPDNSKDLRDAQKQCQQMEIALKREREKNLKLTAKLQQHNSNKNSLIKELQLAKSTLNNIKQEKQQLAKLMDDYKSKIRKLETHQSNQVNAKQLQEVNKKLIDKIRSMKRDNVEYIDTIAKLSQNVEDLTSKLKIAYRAINIKFEENQEGSQGKRQVYENATLHIIIEQLQEKNRANNEKIAQDSVRINELQKQVDQLQYVRQSNNDEMSRLEEQVYQLQQELKQLQQKSKYFEEEKQKLMNYIQNQGEEKQGLELEILVLKEENQDLKRQKELNDDNEKSQISQFNEKEYKLYQQIKDLKQQMDHLKNDNYSLQSEKQMLIKQQKQIEKELQLVREDKVQFEQRVSKIQLNLDQPDHYDEVMNESELEQQFTFSTQTPNTADTSRLKELLVSEKRKNEDLLRKIISGGKFN